MNIWVILIALLSVLFASPIRADWELFQIIHSRKGSVRLLAQYRFKGHTVSIRSTTPDDKERYINLLKKQSHEYIPLESSAGFFDCHNINRQEDGHLYHLYAISCKGEEWGFLHLGRKKTLGVLVKGVWRTYNGEKDTILKLWEELNIIQRDGAKAPIKRIEKRGLARLLPVLDPKLDAIYKEMCLELGFQLVCRLAKEGHKLLPEMKLDENEKEETIPFQVVAELYEKDPICSSFHKTGFTQYKHPSKTDDNDFMEAIFVRSVQKENSPQE